VAEPLIRRVYLFGSRARGTPRPDSDVDLLLFFDLDRDVLRSCRGNLYPARMWTWREHSDRWRGGIGALLPAAVDLQHFTAGPSCLRLSVKRDGIRLYRRNGHALPGV